MLEPSADAVYFASLSVENIRCFAEEVTLDLTDGDGRPCQWTVILGENGTGKTTLLQCLASMTPARELAAAGAEERVIYCPRSVSRQSVSLSRAGDARLARGEHQASMTARLAGTWAYEATVRARIFTPDELATLRRGGGAAAGTYTVYGSSMDSDELERLHVYGYGAHRDNAASRLDSNDAGDSTASLFASNAGVLDASEWLLRLDYLALANPAGPYQAQLERARRALCAVLPDVADIYIQRPGKNHSPARRDLESLVLFKTRHGEGSLGELSLGYHTMLAWLVDFTSRMFERYPDSADPLAEPAVVLIDEIDLHLHPRWQQRIIGNLTRSFPRTQFVVTANGPLVAQAAENATMVLLQRADDHDGDHVLIENRPASRAAMPAMDPDL